MKKRFLSYDYGPRANLRIYGTETPVVCVCVYVCKYNLRMYGTETLWCVCVCVCVYIHTYVYTYIHIHTYMHTYIHTYVALPLNRHPHSLYGLYTHTHTHTHVQDYMAHYH